MSASQSNLSSTGFDYVVAVTQDSINATLAGYLYGGLAEVILCYVYDNNNNPTPIDFNTLVSDAKGTDPFTVPDGTAGTDSSVQNLNNANFAFAIKAKLGLPPGVQPSQLPPIVALKPGQSNVTYTLMFAEFVATELLFGPRGSMTWFNQSQPSGTSWNFSGAVDLNFQDASFTNLPAAVQQRIKDLGDPSMFGVQQLYYDLNSSDLVQGFQFNSLPSNSNLNAFMTADFINTYWKALGGAEVLGYGAKQLSGTSSSPLAVTNLNFFTPDAVGQSGAPLTLNYLCATSNNPLPDTTHAGFGWNWIESNEVSQYDGVAALNRNTLARYLNNASLPGGGSLLDYVKRNCYSPSVSVTKEGFNFYYGWDLTPGQNPDVTYPSSGSTLLQYSYKSIIAASEAFGSMGKLELSSTYDMSVSVQGTQLVIEQHLVVWSYVWDAPFGASGNIVDKTIKDTYTIGVNAQGQIVTTLTLTNTGDASESLDTNAWQKVLSSVTDDLDEWAKSCISAALSDVPVSFVQNFVFPGGATFVFKDASFSDNQDLVSHLTYADPA
jgi:hypothetical protein